MSATEPSLFERTVAVTPRDPGCYDAQLRPEWNGPAAPNGGVLAATMLRAAQAELGSGAPPARTVAAHYLEAPAPGPAQLHVEVLRRGARVRVTEVRLIQGERLAATATIIFSAARPQAATLTRTPEPPLPDPGSVRELSFGDALPGAPPVFERLHIAPALGQRRSPGVRRP